MAASREVHLQRVNRLSRSLRLPPSPFSEHKSQTWGFNAQTEEHVDMIEAGIVDAAKVVRTALQDSASVAGLLITTEAMVAEAPKDKPAMGGGMGGMDF